MELRSAEQEVQSLRALYASLVAAAARHQGGGGGAGTTTTNMPAFPELCSSGAGDDEKQPQPGNGGDDDDNNNHATRQAESNSSSTADDTSAVELLRRLETLRRKLPELEVRMRQFQKRLTARDPVTGKPRYGARTAERVRALLRDHRELAAALAQVWGEEPVVVEEPLLLWLGSEEVLANGGGTSSCSDKGTDATEGANQQQQEEASNNESGGNSNGSAASSTPVGAGSMSIAHAIRQLAETEREVQRRQAEEEQLRRQAHEEAQRREEDRARQQREEAAAERRRQEQEALRERAREAAEARAAAQRARDAEAAAERAWVAGIPHRNTLAGVREQLAAFAESCNKDSSLAALHTIFAQIAAHPEQVNFRRIRRDHPRFLSDIGQYAGGKELLIAAGFELGMVEEVPSFVCREPDIETDMDGWASWFDLLKGTLELIEQEMMK